MVMKMIKNILPYTEKISFVLGALLFAYGSLITYSLLKSDDLFGPDILANLALLGIITMPLFLGFGLFGLGLKWNKKLVMTSFVICSLGIFFFLLFISFMLFNAFSGRFV